MIALSSPVGLGLRTADTGNFRDIIDYENDVIMPQGCKLGKKI